MAKRRLYNLNIRNAYIQMLVYPWGDKTDRHGNADRIRYHDLGLVGDISKDSSSKIKEKIIALKKNERIKKNVTKMQQIFIEYENKENDMIDFILNFKIN